MQLFMAAAALLAGMLPSATARADGAAFTCRPALPFFCRNVHVSCSGVTAIRTSVFKVQVFAEDASVHFAGKPSPDAAGISRGKDLIIRLTGTKDWIRIEPGNRYSHRIYRGGRAAMSYGVCEQE